MNGMVVLTVDDSTRPGSLLLTGSITPFHLQPINIRQQIIQNWTTSYLPPLRNAAKSLSTLFQSVWLKTSPTLNNIIGLPRAPVHGKPGKGFEYEFIQFPPGEEAETIETDVVIIGSGCGGGVCAKNIAESGQRVIVVDKAFYFPAEYLPMTEADGAVHLFQNGGMEFSDDSSILVVAGQTWGGGGTINWSASLQTQNFVRQEWADGGLPFFTSSEFQTSLDRVCARMGVSTEHIEHNKTNSVLLESARKLGYSAKAVPQNTGGNQHFCGYCMYGCGSAEKQGPVVSFLPDAARAGARFVEGFDAQEILFDNLSGKKTAIGVKGLWKSRDTNGGVSGSDFTTRSVIIKARRIIVSCGTLQSPLLLMRSGLRNPHIGRNLHLHPVSNIYSTFDEDTNPWEGGILTGVIESFQDLDKYGHGIKLEAMTMLPAIAMPLIPWTSGLEWKLVASKFKNMVGYISLCRDRDTGRVWADKVDGKCRIAYSPSAFDRKHILEGLIALAKMCYISGAREIMTTTANIPIFVRKDTSDEDAGTGINDAAFQEWLTLVRRKGLPIPDATFASAHQMGTCRMGASERSSVVDPYGKVWGTEGLYISDASVFPSASGVNPMVTNMAISDWISRGLAKEMRKEERSRL